MPLTSADGTKEAEASKSQPDRAMGSACEECSTKQQWIEVQLVDENGVGIFGAEYLIVTPDGREHRGMTDAKGLGQLHDILPGQCSISFPKLDMDAWRVA